MQIKLDEHLGIEHKQLLLSAGFTADRVYDEGLSRRSDAEIWEHCVRQGMILITLDIDFSDVRKHAVHANAGILLLRPRNSSSRAVTDVLQHVIREHSFTEILGRLAVADATTFRLRKRKAE